MFFKIHGPLSFPILILTLSGWYFLTNESSSKISVLTKVYTISHYLSFITIIGAFLVSNFGYLNIKILNHNLDWIFLYQFFPTVLILSTLHMHMLLRNYNTGKLLMDLHALRKNDLRIHNKVTMFIISLTAILILILFFFTYLQPLLDAFHTGTYFSRMIDFGRNVESNGLMAFIVAAIELLFLLFSIWVFTLFNSMIIAFICVMIGNEYEECTNYVEERLHRFNDSTLFLEARHRFRDLTELVSKVDNHFRLYIGITLTTSITLNCVALYVIIPKFKCQDSAHVLYGWIVPMGLIVCNILFLTLPVASLNSKTYKLADAVMRWNTANTDTNLLAQVSAFFQQFSLSQIGLTLGGIVTITKDSVLTIFGTILAYVIIVIQFGQDHENNCNPYNGEPGHQNITNMTLPFP